jgi:hypothetical protein
METRYLEVDMSAKHIVSNCPIEELLVLIGGRWKPVLAFSLTSKSSDVCPLSEVKEVSNAGDFSWFRVQLL